MPPDPVWLARSRAAYGAITAADGPEARWIYQGWALKVMARDFDGGAIPIGAQEVVADAGMAERG